MYTETVILTLEKDISKEIHPNCKIDVNVTVFGVIVPKRSKSYNRAKYMDWIC